MAGSSRAEITERGRIGAGWPPEHRASGALVTYGAPVVHLRDLTRLAPAGHSVYLVLRESIELVADGRSYASYSEYVRAKLGHQAPPVASVGLLAVYRLPGTCPATAPCFDGLQD
jgi:hypothetical protein